MFLVLFAEKMFDDSATFGSVGEVSLGLAMPPLEYNCQWLLGEVSLGLAMPPSEIQLSVVVELKRVPELEVMMAFLAFLVFL